MMVVSRKVRKRMPQSVAARAADPALEMTASATVTDASRVVVIDRPISGDELDGRAA